MGLDQEKCHKACGLICSPLIIMGRLLRCLTSCHKPYVDLDFQAGFESTRSYVKMNHLEDIDELKQNFECNFKSQQTKSQIQPSNFEWIKILGKGAYGKVYLAENKQTKDQYAVKKIKKEKARSYLLLNVMERERTIQSSLDFPFIVKIHNTFSTSNNVFMMMDYCSEGDLMELVSKKKGLNEAETRFYGAQLFMAIDFLHSNHVIHRDIKLANAVLCSDGYLKLTDFGFSKVIEDGRTMTKCGSRSYLAPEILRQFLGLTIEDYGVGVDWWSYGVCMFTMATGDLPFPGEALGYIYKKMTRFTVDYPDHLSVSLVDFIKNLLTVDVNSRLGCSELLGSGAIKQHLFFESTNWSNIFYKKEKAPHVSLNDLCSNQKAFKVPEETADMADVDEFCNF